MSGGKNLSSTLGLGHLRQGYRLLGATLATAALAGCISFGSKPPPKLLTLTPAASAPAGTSNEAMADTALAIVTPAAPQRLNVTRVPVQVNASSIAYLQDAVWVDKPAELLRRLLAETIRAGGKRLVVDEGDLEYAAQTQLTGQLLEMGYDAGSSSVTVRYDAVLQLPDGRIKSQRFEASEANVLPDVDFVGPALNRTANDVAAQVAAWVG